MKILFCYLCCLFFTPSISFQEKPYLYDLTFSKKGIKIYHRIYMTVEIGSVYRQDLSIPLRVENNPIPVSDKVDQPNYLTLLKRAKEKTYSITPLLSSLEKRPLEPIEASPPPPEPKYGSVTAKEWELWVKQKEDYTIYIQRRNIARVYEAENSLRGTF